MKIESRGWFYFQKIIQKQYLCSYIIKYLFIKQVKYFKLLCTAKDGEKNLEEGQLTIWSLAIIMQGTERIMRGTPSVHNSSQYDKYFSSAFRVFHYLLTGGSKGHQNSSKVQNGVILEYS
jgi:hypothetical protein